MESFLYHFYVTSNYEVMQYFINLFHSTIPVSFLYLTYTVMQTSILDNFFDTENAFVLVNKIMKYQTKWQSDHLNCKGIFDLYGGRLFSSLIQCIIFYAHFFKFKQ